MSVCEFHSTYKDESGTSSTITEREPNLIIQDELVWGLSYRHYKNKTKQAPIPPKKSPLDIPFKICREKQRKCLLTKSKNKHSKTAETKPAGPKSKTDKNPTILERSVLSQRKYMDYLSIPKQQHFVQPKKKKKCRCELEPCPPRLVQLALPKKRKVFENWKAYHQFLATSFIMRYEQILHTDKNLEPREARYYYKLLDKKKRKKLRARRRIRKRHRAEKERGDQKWLKEQIEYTVKAIMDYIKEQPLFTLTYKQLLLSDGILERLEKSKIMKKPSRNTKSVYKKTIIEVADKLAAWIDVLTRFVDVQAIDSEDDIPPLTISSLGEGEEEEEEEEEGEGETEESSEGEEGLWGQGEGGGWGEEGEGVGGENYGKFEKMMSDLFTPGEDDGEGDLDDFLEGLNLDMLDRLIKILSNCSEEFLDTLVDDDTMPDVTYIDILNRLKQLKTGQYQLTPKKLVLEDVMIEWAKRNEPDEVDKPLLNEIHEAAKLLGEWWGRTGGARGVIEEIFEKETATGFDVQMMAVGIGGGEDAAGDDLFGDDATSTGLGGGSIGGREEEGESMGGDGDGGDGDGDDRGIGSGLLEEEGVDDGTGMDIYDKDVMTFDGGEDADEQYGEGGMEISILYEPQVGEDGLIIKGHKPSILFDHSPSLVCCLSLKTWAVWLLEITHNAHNWTKWVHCIIAQVREFAAIIRGDVKLPNGQKKVLYKDDWRKFAKETELRIIAWRQYSAHVRELSQSIIDNFHGKKVKCCPKCLQDHLIKNVVHAHQTLQALTEAMDCASYWRRCLDDIMEKTCGLTEIPECLSSESEESGPAEIEELRVCNRRVVDSEDSIYEIEELNVNDGNDGPGAGARDGRGSQASKTGKPGGKRRSSQAPKTCGPGGIQEPGSSGRRTSQGGASAPRGSQAPRASQSQKEAGYSRQRGSQGGASAPRSSQAPRASQSPREPQGGACTPRGAQAPRGSQGGPGGCGSCKR